MSTLKKACRHHRTTNLSLESRGEFHNNSLSCMMCHRKPRLLVLRTARISRWWIIVTKVKEICHWMIVQIWEVMSEEASSQTFPLSYHKLTLTNKAEIAHNSSTGRQTKDPQLLSLKVIKISRGIYNLAVMLWVWMEIKYAIRPVWPIIGSIKAISSSQAPSWMSLRARIKCKYSISKRERTKTKAI